MVEPTAQCNRLLAPAGLSGIINGVHQLSRNHIGERQLGRYVAVRRVAVTFLNKGKKRKIEKMSGDDPNPSRSPPCLKGLRGGA